MKKILEKVLVLAFTLMFTISCTLNDSMFANAISESEENNDNICECGSDHIHDTHDGWESIKKYNTSENWVNAEDISAGKHYLYLDKDYYILRGVLGNTKLNKNVDVTICLNGHKIYGWNIDIEKGSKITIVDCKDKEDKGKIIFEDQKDNIVPGGRFEKYNGLVFNSGELNMCGVDVEYKLSDDIDEEFYKSNSEYLSFLENNHGTLNIVNSNIETNSKFYPLKAIYSVSENTTNIINSKITSKAETEGKIEINKSICIKSSDLNMENSEIISDCQGVLLTNNANIYDCKIIGAKNGVMVRNSFYSKDDGPYVIIGGNSYITNGEKEYLYKQNWYFANDHAAICHDIGKLILKDNSKAVGYNTYGVIAEWGIIDAKGGFELNDNAKVSNKKTNPDLDNDRYDLLSDGLVYINNDNVEKINLNGGRIYLGANLKKEKTMVFMNEPMYLNHIIALDKEDGNKYNGADINIDVVEHLYHEIDDYIDGEMVKDVTDENKDKFKLVERYTRLGYYLEKVEDTSVKGKYNLVLKKRQNPCTIEYEFKPSGVSQKLPDEVTEIKPKLSNVEKGTDVKPEKLKVEVVSVKDGKWIFKGWEPKEIKSIEKNSKFIGTWEFVKNSTGGGTVTPNPDKPVVPNKPTEPDKEDSDRIEGDDRIETAIEASEKLYPNGTDKVVLANAERFSDVLTANPFAVQEKASALLTYKYEIPEKTLKEIERLGAKKIYISGGYDAVSKKVVDELAAKGYEIFRFDGVDRYDTARKIAIKIREKGNTNTAELASGEDFPDALCMTPLAVKDHAPILLTKKDSIPKYTKQALAEWDIENIKIGGLEKAVSPEVEKQLKAGFEIEKNNKKDSNVYDGAKAVKRIGGEDRYETSAKLAKESYPESKLGVYATGEDFPDALIAGNYAGTKEAPVLLVKGDSLPEPIEKYTKESKIKKATIIGGVNAVSDKVFNLIKAIINR